MELVKLFPWQRTLPAVKTLQTASQMAEDASFTYA
jgi:hypothetical protein